MPDASTAIPSLEAEKAAFQASLATDWLGRDCRWLANCASTNRTLLDLAAQGAPHGCLVFADTQTGGRGRLARQWFSPAGVNLYVSFLLKASTGLERLPQLAALTAVSLHQAIAGHCPGLALKLKWPNDLLGEGRKLSGILCECARDSNGATSVVIGLGLNVNCPAEMFPEELRSTAGSLASLTGRLFVRTELLAAFLASFEANYRRWQSAGSLAPFLDYWRCHDLLAGQPVKLLKPNGQLTGLARGLDTEGRLLLETAAGLQACCCGDLIHLRPAASPLSPP